MNVPGEIILNDGSRWQITAELFYDKSPYGIGAWWGSFATVSPTEDELVRLFKVSSNSVPVSLCLHFNNCFYQGEAFITEVDPAEKSYPFRGNGLLEEGQSCPGAG